MSADTVWQSILQPQQADMSAEHARYVLSLTIPDAQKERYRDLVSRRQIGPISADEEAELRTLVEADTVLSLLKSKARLSLRKSTSN